MNLFEHLNKIFTPSVKNEVVNAEKFSNYKISYYFSNFKTFDVITIQNIAEQICIEDTFSLQIKVGENDAIVFDNNENNFIQFSKKIDEEKRIIEDEAVHLKFEVRKNTENLINIYNFDCFVKFWANLSTIDILKLLKKYQNKFGANVFILHEHEIKEFYTRNISFSYSSRSTNNRNNFISENCHFANIEEFPFNAHYFYLIERPTENYVIVDTLDRLCMLFSIACIFDITSIKESNLFYKLNGYKSFEANINIDSLDLQLTGIYYKIFDWIYSEESKISDKIGITRNIISLSLVSKSLSISDSVFISITSGYKAYLQENISKYIEIRNKIVDEISWISQKSSEIIANYLNNYQKSIFTFLSFFISVFILRFLNGGDIEAVFNKEVTIFSVAFLLLSPIYLLFSLWDLKLNKDRLERKYENIKNQYTDLLEQADINRILKDNIEFNYEMDFIEMRKKNYTILWISTIIVLLSAVLSVSNYLNWDLIINFLSKL